MVIATQNPIELDGTYPLPEAQLDRFLMRIPMGYPGRDAEAAILDSQGRPQANVDDLKPVVAASDVAAAIASVATVHVAPEVRDYILDLVAGSRRHPDLVLGASPRGSLNLQKAARALAATLGRAYVTPDDVKQVFGSVLEHRVLLAPDAALPRRVHHRRRAGAPRLGAGPRPRPAPEDHGDRPVKPERRGVTLTRRGWSLFGAALGLCVGSYLLGALEMLVIGVAAILLLGVVSLWLTLREAPELAVSRRVRPDRLHVGSEGRIDLTVENLGRHATPMFAATDWFDEGRRAARFLVPPLAPGATGRAAYRVPTRRRGRYHVGPLALAASDPFGLARRPVGAAGDAELVIRPRIHDIVAPVAIGSRVAAESEAAAARRSPVTSGVNSSPCAPTRWATISAGCTGVPARAVKTS